MYAEGQERYFRLKEMATVLKTPQYEIIKREVERRIEELNNEMLSVKLEGLVTQFGVDGAAVAMSSRQGAIRELKALIEDFDLAPSEVMETAGEYEDTEDEE